MEIEKQKAIIEAILFAAGRVIKINELMGILELSSDDVVTIIDSMKEDYKNADRGIEIIRVEDGYQLTTKKEMYEYLYPIFDKRSKPNLTQASMETLAIIAYNPKITRAEIEAIRGVNSDGTISLCFLDWHRKLVIGDAKKQKIKEVWLGKEMKNYQKLFLEGKRKTHYICQNCGQLKQGQPDDIDMFANELLKKI